LEFVSQSHSIRGNCLHIALNPDFQLVPLRYLHGHKNTQGLQLVYLDVTAMILPIFLFCMVVSYLAIADPESEDLINQEY